MGLVRTEITLKNAVDVGNTRTGMIKDKEIRQTTVQALVDTGAWNMVINEATRKTLGLEIVGSRPGTLADGTRAVYNLAGPLEVWWKDRWMTCDAIVVPNADEILLGAIPLEAMDLMVDPCGQRLVGVHGDEILHTLK